MKYENSLHDTTTGKSDHNTVEIPKPPEANEVGIIPPTPIEVAVHSLELLEDIAGSLLAPTRGRMGEVEHLKEVQRRVISYLKTEKEGLGEHRST